MQKNSIVPLRLIKVPKCSERYKSPFGANNKKAAVGLPSLRLKKIQMAVGARKYISPNITNASINDISGSTSISKQSRSYMNNTKSNIKKRILKLSPTPTATRDNININKSNKSFKRRENCSLTVANRLPKIPLPKNPSYLKLKVPKFPRVVYALSQNGTDEYCRIKTNQDSYLIYENVFNHSKFDIFGIFDGHGSNGHHVSQFVVSYLRNYFSLPSNFKDTSLKSIYSQITKKSFNFLYQLNHNLQNELCRCNFDIQYSGTTCLIIFIINNSIIVSNTGDSRCILVTSKDYAKKETEVKPLSFDHKPNITKERRRIEANGGEVLVTERDGPFRVYKKGEDLPGIAMSRSLGDLESKKVGVCFMPEIICADSLMGCRYIVAASDGLWDMLKNEEVMEIVNKYYANSDAEGAIKELIKEASKRYDDNNEARDDITVVIYFFEKM